MGPLPQIKRKIRPIQREIHHFGDMELESGNWNIGIHSFFDGSVKSPISALCCILCLSRRGGITAA